MDFNEFKILVKGMKAVYTSERFLPDGDSVKIWFSMLSDLDYRAANAAIQKYILTNKFPPTIAEIRELATDIVQGKLPDWGEAWAEATEAIRRFGMYRPEEAMASLSPLTRETVKRLGFRSLCLSENEMADRANFRQCYETLCKREQQDKALPAPLQETIKQLQGSMKMIEDKGE